MGFHISVFVVTSPTQVLCQQFQYSSNLVLAVNKKVRAMMQFTTILVVIVTLGLTAKVSYAQQGCQESCEGYGGKPEVCTTLCATVADYCKGDDISDADCNKKCEAMIPRENCPPLCTNVMAICNASESEPEMGSDWPRCCGERTLCLLWGTYVVGEVASCYGVNLSSGGGVPGYRGVHTHTHTI